MQEAIDYNALSWVRKELTEILKQARLKLEAYAPGKDDSGLLHECATLLHEARGPLRMAGLRGADRLAAEMEELLTDLLQETAAAGDAELELLMQAFLQLPDYLSRIRSGRLERPAELLPVINELRASRGAQPLRERAFFAPDLSAPVPESVFSPGSAPADIDLQNMARSARMRFQGGLLEWYRGGAGNTGMQALLGVLESLLQCAGTEAAARVWWAGAGLADAVIAGELPDAPEIKQLFGQLDRQIKRLLDSGESVFADAISAELLGNLLFEISRAGPCTGRVDDLKSAYGLNGTAVLEGAGPAVHGGMSGIGIDLLQTMSRAVTEDIDRIKERLDEYAGAAVPDVNHLLESADRLHALGNTLDMAGLGDLQADIFSREQQLRVCMNNARGVDATELRELAAMLVAVEDAVLALAVESADRETPDTAGSLAFRQGVEAVAREVLADISRVKEAVSDYSMSAGQRDVLAGVPDILERTGGSLQLAGQARAAAVAKSIGGFVAAHMQDAVMDAARLELLADTLCSVEYYIEGLLQGDDRGAAALGMAEDSMDRLASRSEAVPGMPVSGTAALSSEECAADVHAPVADSDTAVVSGQPVIAADADEEILSIFLEEAGEQLAALRDCIPVLLERPADAGALAGVQRAFHTLKGSGRMLGAMAIGEFAWRFEMLLSQVIEGTVQFDGQIGELLAATPAALEQLLGQVNGAALSPDSGIDDLARQAARLSEPAAAGTAAVTATEDDAGSGESANKGIPAEPAGLPDLPVLSEDADGEIVEIFLEEAAEQAASIAGALPAWLDNPDDGDALAVVRCSFHMLKGSGRMAGAMRVGEFSWAIEDLLNRLIDGSVQFSDSLALLLGQCGEALSQLVTQVQDGTDPAVDVQEIMASAAALARGENPGQEAAAASVAGEAGEDDATPGEPTLLEVFSNECRDHLEAINTFIAGGDEERLVTEPLYRALHTLSGISESAEIDSIQGLAGDLNVYFDELYQLQQPLSHKALEVLGDAAVEMQRLMEQLPDQSCNEMTIMALRDRIAELPRPAGTMQPALPETTADDSVGEAVVAGSVEQTQHGAAELERDLYAGLDQELYEIFIEESTELVDASESVLRSWSEHPENHELLAEFQRQLHTLKGGARMVDIQAIGDLSHAVESLLARVADGAVAVSGKLFTVLHASQDRLAEMLDRVKARELPGPARDLEQELEALAAGQEPAVPVEQSAAGTTEQAGADAEADAGEPAPENDHNVATVPDAEGSSAAVAADAHTTQATADQDAVVEQVVAGNISTASAQAAVAATHRKERRKSSRARGEQVRVQSGLLDDMVNHAGEINIYRTRMEQQISDYRFNLAELDQTISRLREQLRQLEMETEIQVLFQYQQEEGGDRKEFDPLELDRYSNLQQLSRSLMESISDLRSLQDLMELTTRESETLLLQQSRVSTDLQEGLMRTRMIPFAGLASRLRRIVRQTARQLDKKAELTLQGGEGEIDRTVIDRIVAPLEHMLRNAVAHGIEHPKVRNKAGKAETGNITVSFEREGPEIVLRIVDDGAGMDIEAIRERALERGLMAADSGLKDDEIMQFVLQTGFSTASDITQISGRGVGMDVVNSEVKQLGGSLHLESIAGEGSIFTLRLPYTLAINQVLLVKAGEQDFCIPLGSIEGVVRATPRELAACYTADEHRYEYAGNQYRLKHLGSVLGTGAVNLEQQQERVPVLLARIGEKRMALQVEALLGSREIVIKPVGVQLSCINGISGATILGDGRVVLILDMAALVRMQARKGLPGSQVVTKDESRIVVMVVDDSITVRKVTTRLLERNGFKVLTAKDGVDAVGQLQRSVPDMMLLDIEMPRMDGFELATHMRNDEGLKHVPIIMITSRTGDKHRQRAQEIGVNNYLGKPYQENDLLDSIHHIIGVPAA